MAPRQSFALPYMLLAVGMGLSGYYGLEWLKLPAYSEADIEASAALNLQLELQQPGQSLGNNSAQLQERLARLRQEVRVDIAQERKAIETGLGIGLIALVAAGGNFLLGWLLRRRPQS